MNAKQLYIRTSKKTHRFKPTKAWYCTKCRFVAPDAAAAKRCCDYHCNTCGKPTKKYILQCDDCRRAAQNAKEQERFDKAFKHTPMSIPADTPLYCDMNERFYPDIDTAMESLEHEFEDDPEREILLWLCDKEAPSIDPDVVTGEQIYDSWELSSDTDLEAVCEGLDEVRAAIVAFNKKQKPTLWREKHAACVLLTKDDYAEAPKPETTAAT